MSMGSRVNPHTIRVGVIKDWDSKWYAEESYEQFRIDSAQISKFLKSKCFKTLNFRREFLIECLGDCGYNEITKTLKKR